VIRHDLLHGTSHVDVDQIGRIGAGQKDLRRFGHDFGLRAEDLNGGRVLPLAQSRQTIGLFIMIMERFGADHFGHRHIASLLPTKQSEGTVGNAGHGSKHKAACKGHISNVHHAIIIPDRLIKSKGFSVLFGFRNLFSVSLLAKAKTSRCGGCRDACLLIWFRCGARAW